jgi:hypothetical protein
VKASEVALGILLSAASAQGDVEEDRLIAEERERYEQHRTLSVSGSHSVVDLEWLANDLKFEEGKLSVVPDPKDRGNGQIAVYVVNASPEPAAAIVWGMTDCIQEANYRGRWTRSEDFKAGCGSVPEAESLPPGKAFRLTAPDPAIGDTEGEIRYTVTPFSLSSVSLKGRYFEKTARRMSLIGPEPLEAKLEEWKIPVLHEILREDPPEALSILGIVGRTSIEYPPPYLPEAFREPIRDYLLREAGDPTVRGEDVPEDRSILSIMKLNDSMGQKVAPLKCALAILGHWNRTEDRKLLLSFIEYPVWTFDVRERGLMRRYDLRIWIKQILDRRKETLPPGVVFEEEVKE